MRKPERLDNKPLIKIIKKQIRLCLRYKYFRSLIFVSMRTKRNNYVICGRDGSRRKLGKGCPWGHFEDTAFTRFKKWLSRIFK